MVPNSLDVDDSHGVSWNTNTPKLPIVCSINFEKECEAGSRGDEGGQLCAVGVLVVLEESFANFIQD